MKGDNSYFEAKNEDSVIFYKKSFRTRKYFSEAVENAVEIKRFNVRVKIPDVYTFSNWKTWEQLKSYEIFLYILNNKCKSIVFVNCNVLAYYTLKAINQGLIDCENLECFSIGKPSSKQILSKSRKLNKHMDAYVEQNLEKSFPPSFNQMSSENNAKVILSYKQNTSIKNSADEPSVAVIVTHFNLGEYLDLCLSDLINQTYRNYRIIVVDDSSNETSSITLLETAKDKYINYENILFVSTESNLYVGGARNFGASFCTEEYLIFFDVDNRCKPSFIEDLMKAALNSGSKIVAAGSLIGSFAPGMSLIEVPNHVVYKRITLGFNFESQEFNNQYGDATFAIENKTFRGLKGFKEFRNTPFEDWEFFKRYFHSYGEIECFLIPNFYYNVRRNSMLHSTKPYDSLRKLQFPDKKFESEIINVAVRKKPYFSFERYLVNFRNFLYFIVVSAALPIGSRRRKWVIVSKNYLLRYFIC